MSYDEMQKYRDQEPFAPSWSPYLKDIGPLVADCQSLLCSIDAKPTCADSIKLAELTMDKMKHAKVGLQRSWESASAEEREWLLQAVRGESCG
jgi:hypothetical protein